MGKESSTKRVIEILKELDSGATLSIAELAEQYSVSERSIYRDIELLKSIYDEAIIAPSTGYVAMLSKNTLAKILTSSEIAILKSILRLGQGVKLGFNKYVDSAICAKLIDADSNSPYIFKSRPFEEIYTHQDMLQKLESAINRRVEIQINYGERNLSFCLRPYKIMWMNENFYLASERVAKSSKVAKSERESEPNKEAKPAILFHRIALINQINIAKKSFYQNKDMLDFLHFINSPWATYKENFREHLVAAKVLVPHIIARYFVLKKFHPTQEILELKDNGDLVISFTLTSQNELLPLLKQWLPHIAVLSPKSLKSMYADQIVHAYKNLDRAL